MHNHQSIIFRQQWQHEYRADGSGHPVLHLWDTHALLQRHEDRGSRLVSELAAPRAFSRCPHVALSRCPHVALSGLVFAPRGLSSSPAEICGLRLRSSRANCRCIRARSGSSDASGPLIHACLFFFFRKFFCLKFCCYFAAALLYCFLAYVTDMR